MSISSTTSRNDYTGNDAVDTYGYTYRIFNQSDLLVTVKDTSDVETTLVISTDYTVTGVGDASGGNIVLVNASQAWLTAGKLTTGFTLTVRRVVDVVQETDIRNQGDFFPEVHEDAFDYGRMVDQQQQDEIDRSVKSPESLPSSTFDPTLPADMNTANVTIKVNAAATGFEVGPSTAEIAAAAAEATAAAASAAAALVSENAASASESAALVSENAAAASAAAAATAAANSQWSDVSYKTFADTPIAIVDGDAGTLFSVDCTSGNVVINLPAISALTLSNPWVTGFKKTDSSANTITVNRNGTDTIDGNTSVVIDRQYAGRNFIPDTDGSPDDWTTIEFGEVPISGAIVGTTDVQDLSNKTFVDAITLEELTGTPSTPASGDKKLYAKNDGQIYTLDDTGSEATVGGSPVVYVKHVLASGNAGGTATLGSFETRPLNTTEGATSLVSLSSNQFTLQSGTYALDAVITSRKTDLTQMRLRNITDSSTALSSSSMALSNGDSAEAGFNISGSFTIASAKAFEIQQRSATTVTTNGFGSDGGYGEDNVFATVKITKTA